MVNTKREPAPVESVVKRLIDCVVAGSALSLLTIPFVAIAIAIKADSKGPVFYRGVRIGRHGVPFRLFKFRSMVPNDGLGPTTTSQHDPRITKVGGLLRKYKLDELPQLINVLLGDMSLVGPRPQVKWAVDLFSDEERIILNVRPGITDWASMRFHNEEELIAKSGFDDPDEGYMKLIHPEKTRLQLAYVQKQSLAVDARILFGTLATLIKSRSRSSQECP